jgi:hypothetical protein
MSGKRLRPVHPGEVLREDFLTPLGLTQYRLAKSLSVPPRRINEIVHGKRAVTADRPAPGKVLRHWSLRLNQTGFDSRSSVTGSHRLASRCAS